MRRSLTITLAAAAMLAYGIPAASAASTGTTRTAPPLAAGGWGTAKELPGTGALNTEGAADVNSVSCTSAGNCSVGGSYQTLVNGNSVTRPFVDTEANGRWQKAREVQGIAAWKVHRYASVRSVSCSSAGNCSAAGYYRNNAFGTKDEPFVVSETGGTWGSSAALAGLPANGSAELMSLSCGGPGDCSAGGYYTDGNRLQQAFVVSQNGGTWGSAEEVPGTAALNTGGVASLYSVSCASAGNCSAGGYYIGSHGDQAFAVTETGGIWGNAEEVPGTAALNTGGDARLDSVSCSSAGDCGAGGSYTDSSGNEGFVVSETDGTWGTAQAVPGVEGIGPLSCTSQGNCGAGAYDEAPVGPDQYYQAYVVSETDGTWGTAEEVPGIAALDSGGDSFMAAFSCGAAGDCSAGGDYTTNGVSGATQAYVVNEVNGTWGTVEDLPGTSQGSGSEGGGSSVGSMSCVSAAHCVAGGTNPDSSGAQQAFVASRT
jgi:hypothetical protein